MTITQIHYFLALAHCLSYTDAAKLLYITQPTLSRQIASMEKELGFQLFIRDTKTTKLTLAGKRMQAGLSQVRDLYDVTVRESATISRTFSGNLRVGVLDYQSAHGAVIEAMRGMKRTHPNVYVEILPMGYGGLRDSLSNGSIDVAIINEFALSGYEGMASQTLFELSNYLVVPADHPNANKKNPSIADFKDCTFLGMDEREVPAITELIRNSCRQAGFEPQLRLAKSYGEFSLTIETGQAAGGLNDKHFLFNNPHVKFLKVPEIKNGKLVAVWSKKTQNPTVGLFLGLLPRMEEPHEAF